VNVSADIGDSVQQFSDEFFAWLPRLIGAIVILLIAYLIAKAVRKLIERALPKTGIDRAVHSGRYGEYVSRYASGFSPTAVIAAIAFWFIFLTGVLLALSTLGIEALDNAIAAVVGYLPNVVVAILIFIVAALLAGAVAKGASRVMGENPMGQIVAAVAPALIMVLAMFMILEQLNIAEQIVEIAFAATMGALALGLALAFGLGGRPVAQRLLEDAYAKGRSDATRARTGAAVPDPRHAETDTQPMSYTTTRSGGTPGTTPETH
jgi:hypothetical protein